MLAGQADLAVQWGRRAIALATELGVDDVLMHAQNNVGAALGCAGQLEAGVELLERSLDLALAQDAQEHVARAFCNLASVCVSNHRIDAAQRYLDMATAYCAERDLDTWRLSIETEIASAELAAGQWDAALRRCAEIIRDGRGSAVIEVTALWVMGVIEARRGLPGAQGHLAQAQALAARMHDPQSRIPVAVARAEAAWGQGRFAETRAEVDRVFPLAVQSNHGWWLGEVAWWSMLSGSPRVVPGTTEPHDLMLDGQWRAGADAWERHRNPFWRALCLAQSDDQDDARAAHALLTSLGATTTLAAVQREWRRRGVPVPRGARVTRRSDPHGLTERELDVVDLLGDGLSNAEIAARLVISERTAAHHVSAVLRKLDAPSRTRAVAVARRLGIVAPLDDRPEQNEALASPG